ncbi:mucin-4 [Condylostylus longicornis]|uniref:mucin-4 n=1 Tax=Condylostylus longicornis TaxID=2530218 RepID=UPI00244DD3CA|nr:mucin-4 [Condylostylus longicornis]XP_055388720.1 mucin-4 [Condylostylus longicornis]XP_055388728.1 mucin-4 [Condylostylus longicornis]XP_055388736.1 mucin-4 [Condylostylus longicornis]XP_055388744.1 mucin-4 [Condylostylus longicornis]
MSLEQGVKISNAINTATKGTTKLSKISEYNKSMVLSAMPLDQSKIVVQQSTVGSRLTAITNSQHTLQQQQQLTNGNIVTNFSQFSRNPQKIIATGLSQPSSMSTTQNVSQVTAMHSSLQSNHSISQSTSNQQHSISKIVGSTSSPQSQSKFVFFQQNGNVHYASNEAFITTSSASPNSVGNIVIVATEPMDLNNADNLSGSILHTANGSVIQTRPNLITNGDEDLTSLTWLQDKNLIKGIVSRNNSNRNVHNIQSPTKLSNRSISPSTELVEETVVHNETGAELNLDSSKQLQTNSNILNNESSYQKVITSQSNNKSIMQHQHLGFSPNPRQVQVTPQNHAFISSQFSNNIGGRTNKSQILAPVSSSFITTSASMIPERITNNLSNVGTTTTVHVGPSGTTTVVEYKNKANYISSNSKPYSNEIHPSNISNYSQNAVNPIKNQLVSNNTLQQNNQVVTSNVSPNALQSLTESSNKQNACNNVVNQPQTISQSTTHHPHKKYLREQMSGREQSKITSNISQPSLSYQQNNNVESRCNTGIESINETTKLSAVCASDVVNYSGDRKNISIINKVPTNSTNNSSHKEFVLPSSDYTNTVFSENLGTPCSTQIIYKEYDTESAKDISKRSNIVVSNKNSTISTKEQALNSLTIPLQSPKQKHPNNIPYDPKTHANAKPPYSFSSLIFMAIEDSSEKALPVKEIYAWIVQHFPYFKTAPTGWKNSVRHNLSLNKSFLKVEKAPNMGKGSLWRVEQHQRPNLIQALTRSPFYPCPAVDKLSNYKNSINEKEVTNESYNMNDLESPPTTPVKSNLDAKLFPKLSKLMKEMGNVQNEINSTFPENGIEVESLEQSEYQSDLSSYSHNVSSNNSSVDGFFPQKGNSTPNYDNMEKLARDCGADSIDDVNAATAMLALKHGSKIFNADNFSNGTPVITNSPSADHTYSAGNSNSPNEVNNGNCSNSISFDIGIKNGSDNISTCASSDAAYESSDESHNLTPDELEHQRRVEGVDALLSLSSIYSQSTISNGNLKRPAIEFIEERGPYLENIPHMNGKNILSTNSVDEGYNTQGNYSHITFSATPISLINVVTPTTSGPPLPKKMRSSRLRAKIKQIKRKTASLR